VCTIHQPSIDIFEAFDELVLLKRGGETIFCGSLGEHSRDLIDYFSAIKGVPPAKEGLNPATWMLEVSTPGAEQRTGVDFAEIYKGSEFARKYQQVIEEFSQPAKDAKAIHFDSAYAKSLWGQYVTNLWRFNITYWRTTEYNSVRFLLTAIIGLVFGFIFWKLGGHVRTELGIQNVLGALYASVIFLGIINSIVLQPIAAENRGVLYRERAAGLYAIFPWIAAMMTMEVVYCTVQSVLYCCIVYFACGFARDPAKFFWFLLFLWQLLLFFTLFGLTAVALTPNIRVAAVFSSNFYSLFNLFAGFIMPVPQMPGWWVWLAYLNPCYWTIYGLVASQVGDFTNELTIGSGGTSTPKAFIDERYGYRHNFLGQVTAILFSWLIFLFAISYICFRYVNHLKR
jgi:ABC-type multidrug transport system permease subunit